jgi:hypothetical protein
MILKSLLSEKGRKVAFHCSLYEFCGHEPGNKRFSLMHIVCDGTDGTLYVMGNETKRNETKPVRPTV